MKLPDFSVKKPVTISMLILIVIVMGTVSLSRMGLDLMPDVTFPMVTVVSTYEGVNPQDMEDMVTRPLEDVVATIKGVKKINAITREGLTALMVEFEWGTNIDLAAQDIRDNLDMMQSFLPDDISDPQVIKFNAEMMPVFGLGVTGEMEDVKLRKLAEDEIETALEQVDGVSAVYMWGGAEEEIRIELDLKKLSSYKIPSDMVIAAIGQQNLNSPSGRIEQNYKEITLRAVGEFETVSDVEDTAVTRRGGETIYVSDLGRVERTTKDMRAKARTNSKSSVMIMPYKESGANPVLVSERINEQLDSLEKRLPSHVNISAFLDMGQMITRILRVTLSSALWGGLLAVGVLYFFLGSWRPTVIIATAIPLSLLATFLPLFGAGYTINFVILIGAALGVGMIVDNAIVVIENSYRHLKITDRRKMAASMGAKQVGMAITASTFTTIVVFIPLLFAGGVVGKIFSQLAVTVASALVCSLIVALTIIPMLSSKILSTKNLGQKRRWMDKSREWYGEKLTYFLENKAIMLFIILILVILSIAAFPFMGKEYFPSIDQSMLMMKVQRDIGTVLEETDRIVARVEEEFSSQEEILNYSGMMGVMEGGEIDAAMGTGPTGPHEADIFVRLKEKTDRQKGHQEIKDEVIKNLPRYEDASIEFIDMGEMMLTGGGMQDSPIQINIYGSELEVLDSVADDIKNKIENIPGVYNLDVSIDKGRPELDININRKRAAQYGVSVLQINRALQNGVKGTKAGKLRQGGDELDIKVIFEEKDRLTVQQIENIPIMTDRGAVLSVGQLADFTYKEGPTKLERDNRRRVMTVSGNYRGSDFSGVMNKVRDKVDGVFLPSGYTVSYGGEAEDLQEMFITLIQVFALAILLIYMVMAAQFESFIHPLIIMLTIPLSYIGVVWMLIMTGKSISMPAAMGVLILFGIIVNNAIVLIDYINRLRRHQGLDIRKAVIEGGKVRLRPILMTALTTIFAMVPMALNKMEGAAIRSVVAISIIGGLLVGTGLTLFVIPLIYDFIEHRFEKIKS
ncbi:MAG: efflux RND transporter permease subunit [Elusimicrobiota bacterium]